MNKHQVFLPCGAIAKRVSKDRTYSHCVAVRPCFERYLAAINDLAAIECDAANFRYAFQVAGGHRAVSVQELDRCKALVQSHLNPNCYAEAERRRKIAALEARRAAGEFDRWSVVGWNGNARLAEKLAASQRSSGWCAEVRVLVV
jgi:hypothetical protein